MNRTEGFDQKCYRLLRQVPAGRVTTYREIARALGSRAWRAVGSAMAKNKHLVTVPCHRVVRSDGSIGQYASGADVKAALLQSEGVALDNNKVADLNRYMYYFS